MDKPAFATPASLLGVVTGMIETLRGELMVVLPDFGRHLGYDGKAIENHSSGQVNHASGEACDPDADWGKHETGGVHARTAKPWSKIKTEKGNVHCICALTGEQRDLAFQGFESNRNCLKYRCSATACGVTAWTTASASSGISSAAWPRCKLASAWSWRS